ncbi:DivIVA domain-containing protein [Micromonospora sp. ALFpr18c]|uniref:DivIVA domain-containing protein n=1 Tax=unclassified Micromonospora TaxID=2617518 RepID=UPI00124B74B1|nr:DivIVA domain-containing protein [Micromonospora sp. ALFpr18c]KAB1938080.1 DivIVA domain-containing protein [Micromonospora sp. ALFpr18c]
MRVFFRHTGRRQRSVHGPTSYRSAAYHPLRPWQVREKQFRPTPLGRRGVEPGEVQEFLDRVAGDLAVVYDALAQSRRETERVKEALRQWQSAQARARNERSQGR